VRPSGPLRSGGKHLVDVGWRTIGVGGARRCAHPGCARLRRPEQRLV